MTIEQIKYYDPNGHIVQHGWFYSHTEPCFDGPKDTTPSIESRYFDEWNGPYYDYDDASEAATA